MKRKEDAFDLSLPGDKSDIDDLLDDLSEAIKVGKGFKAQKIAELWLGFARKISDPQKQAMAIERVMKSIGDQAVLDEEEIVRRMPKQVLALIAGLESRGITPYDPAME